MNIGIALVAAALAFLVAACGDSSSARLTLPASAPVLEIKSLSNRADLIADGQAYVELKRGDGKPIESYSVALGSRDVTAAFARRGNGRVLGVVTGLALGDNVLTAKLPDGSGAQLTLTNHPIGGPVMAGPQVQPWLCITAANGLGEPQDAQCNAPTVFSYSYYSSATKRFASYDPKNPPRDVATATTTEGKTVPFIVRVERGTMDRGIYEIAVLMQPDEVPLPWSPPAAWNGKVVITFGGGAASKHMQSLPSVVLNNHALKNGFLVASNGLLINGNNANTNVSSEALMMLKERITEGYGEIAHTIGEGCSGGSLQQHLIASMYPGLLDGLLPSCSFADLWTTVTDVFDCSTLLDYYNRTSPQLWAVAAQRQLVDGNNHSVCVSWEATFASRLDPTFATGCSLPAEQVYHPQNNPRGVRCTLQDYQKAIWGLRPEDGFAQRPLDNVGVQYGLNTFLAGEIVAEQFLDLNEKVGSKNIDGVFVRERFAAEPQTLATAYRTAQVSDARQLASVPIIDLRGQDNEEIHTSYNSYVIRARLQRDNGHHDNQLIWTGPVAEYGDPAFACGLNFTGSGFPDLPDETCVHSPLLLIDDWLDAIAADAGTASRAEKVRRNKPAAAVDTCFIGGQPVRDAARCAAAFPYFSSPRLVAGMPMTHDALKCALKPLARADYGTRFSDAQWARMLAAFPDGVCDWSQPGIGQQASVPWQSFMQGAGGRALGVAPASKPLLR